MRWKCCQSSKVWLFQLFPLISYVFIIPACNSATMFFLLMLTQKKNVMLEACRQSLKLMCGREVHSLIKFRVVFGICENLCGSEYLVASLFMNHSSLTRAEPIKNAFWACVLSFNFTWRLFFLNFKTIIAHFTTNYHDGHKKLMHTIHHTKSKASSFHS